MNNAQALALRDWLAANGWGSDDIFLDIDPASGIAPGERWQRSLNEAAGRCEAVVFLISPEWLASRWCLEELSLAHKLNKRLFGVLIGTVKTADIPARLSGEWQLVDLESGRDGIRIDVELPDGTQGFATFSKSGLQRFRTGLRKAGLDPRFFAWPPADEPGRAPYRGLAPMEAEDAGIFYGREAVTVAALDQLRGLAEAAPPRLMAVLGASGAGKSSFMRAGLIPRLKRDDRTFLVLPVLRPERAVLSGPTGLAAGLAEAAQLLGLKNWTKGRIATVIAGGPDEVSALLNELAAAAAQEGGAGTPHPTMVLPIDQAEELFLAAGRDEAQAFMALLARLLSNRPPRLEAPGLIALATIRTDSYQMLQHAPQLSAISQTPFSLPPLARGAYQTVIEGPAERLAGSDRALKVEPALTEALLRDIDQGGAKDALPLLAFTLERLYIEHGSDGDLTLAEYTGSGGISGAIEAAVERALAASDADPGVPRDRQAKLALLRRGMIPWLASIDPETKTARRQVARFSDIPDEARPLIERFVDQHLLSTDMADGERTIEPAHEALLRQWGQIDAWLKDDIAELATLEGVRRAARDWHMNRRDPNWLAHTGGRLDDADAIKSRVDLVRRLDQTDLAYLDACRADETAKREKELEEARRLAEAQKIAAERLKQVARRNRIGAVAAILLAIAAVGVGFYGQRLAREARILGDSLMVESAQRGIKVADTLMDRGAVDAAALLLLDAAEKLGLEGGEVPEGKEAQAQELQIALERVGEIFASRTVEPIPANQLGIEGPDGLYMVDRSTFEVLSYTDAGLQAFSPASTEPGGLIAMSSVSTDRTVTLLLEDGRLLRSREGQSARLVTTLTGDVGYLLDQYTTVMSRDGVISDGIQFVDIDDTVVSMPGSRVTHYLHSEDGRRFFWGGSYYDDDRVKLLEVKRKDASISFEEVYLSHDEFNPIVVHSCFLEGFSLPPPELESTAFSNGGETRKTCTWYKVGTKPVILYSNKTTGSGGAFFNYQVYTGDDDPNGEGSSLISSGADSDLDTSLIAWAGLDRTNNIFGAIVGRNVVVVAGGSAVFNRRHQSRMTAGHFFDGGRLSVVDSEMNAIVSYDWTSSPVLPEEEALGEKLHTEYCEGDAFQIDGQVSASIKNYVLSIAAAETSANLPIGEYTCVRLSFDRRFLVRDTGTNSFDVIDISKLLADHSVDSSTALPGRFRSAYFVRDGSIVTSDGGYTVQLWSRDTDGEWASRQIYDGDRRVVEAEPNKDASLLILKEDLGGSNYRVLLYGVLAGRTWRDMGSEYKMIGGYFLEDGTVAIASGSSRRVELGTLSEALLAVRNGLANDCDPKIEGDYTSSRCWKN